MRVNCDTCYICHAVCTDMQCRARVVYPDWSSDVDLFMCTDTYLYLHSPYSGTLSGQPMRGREDLSSRQWYFYIMTLKSFLSELRRGYELSRQQDFPQMNVASTTILVTVYLFYVFWVPFACCLVNMSFRRQKWHAPLVRPHRCKWKAQRHADHQMGHLILESSGKILHWFMCRTHENKIRKILGYL